MNIQDLKQELLDGTLNEDLIIFVNSENSFLAESYINEICERKNLTKNYVETLAETTESALSLVMDFSNDLNIVKVDEFNEIADDYSEFKNCIVICNKVSPEVKEAANEFIVNIPKLTDWQIKDYIKTYCPGIKDELVDWLYEACCKDIYKINNELSLLSLIEPENLEKSIAELRQNNNSDLFIKKSVFSLVDALIKGDKDIALDFLKHADYYSRPYISSAGTKERDLDPVGLTSLLLQKYKNILLLNFKSGIDETQLGLSKGAIWHLKNEAKNIPLTQIMKAIDFLSKIDSRLKQNPSALDFLDCQPTAMLEYIILGAIACCE